MFGGEDAPSEDPDRKDYGDLPHNQVCAVKCPQQQSDMGLISQIFFIVP